MIAYIYTPILKGKQYDIRALGSLAADVRSRIKPIIELPPVAEGKSPDEHLQKFLQNLTRYGGSGESFIDFYGFLPGERDAAGTLATIAGYRLLLLANRRVTPVYGLGRDNAVWAPLKDVIASHGQGFCFRLEEDDLDEDQSEATWEEVLVRMAELDLTPEEVDLAIDLRDVREKDADEKTELVTDFLALKPAGQDFRSVSVIGSSAPKDVTVVEQDSVGTIFRNELKIWGNLVMDVPLMPRLLFGDYGVVHPDFAADDLPVGGTANCKIRYTAGRQIIIFRGHKRAGDVGQPHHLASLVLQHTAYRGPEYSFGDAYIQDVANRTKGPGNLGNWVQADLSHHLAYTARQIGRVVAQIDAGASLTQLEGAMDQLS